MNVPRALSGRSTLCLSLVLSLGTDKDDDAISTALINAMNQMQTTAKQHKSSPNSNKLNEEHMALKINKSHVLAKYSEVSDEELDYGHEEGASDNGVFHNNNAQEIEDREKKARELQHEVKLSLVAWLH